MSASGSPIRRSGVRFDQQAVGEDRAGLGDHLHRRGHRDRADAVDPDPERPPLAGQALQQAALGGFDRAVRRAGTGCPRRRRQRSAGSASPADRVSCGKAACAQRNDPRTAVETMASQTSSGHVADAASAARRVRARCESCSRGRRTARPWRRRQRRRRPSTPTSHRSDSAVPAAALDLFGDDVTGLGAPGRDDDVGAVLARTRARCRRRPRRPRR